MYKLLDEIDSRDAIKLMDKYLDRFRPVSGNIKEWTYNLIDCLKLSVGPLPRSAIWVAEYFDEENICTLLKRSDTDLFLAVVRVAVEQALYFNGCAVTDNLMVWVPERKYLIRCQSYDNYWNNELGWVDEGSATEFSESDKERLNLPIDGMWEGTGEWV